MISLQTLVINPDFSSYEDNSSSHDREKMSYLKNYETQRERTKWISFVWFGSKNYFGSHWGGRGSRCWYDGSGSFSSGKNISGL